MSLLSTSPGIPDLQIQSTGAMHEHKPRVLRPERDDVIAAALATDAVARRILAKGNTLCDGQLVGVRLNINVLKNTGVAVHSIHKPTSQAGHREGRGFYRGEVLSYEPVVVLRDAFFNVHQAGREGIASGRLSKHPMASIDGNLLRPKGPPCFEGTAVGFNPMRSHLFTDEDGYAVQFAREVTILGHRAYARHVTYFSEATSPRRAGGAPSNVRFRH